MNQLLGQQLKRIELQEKKILGPSNRPLLETTLSPILDKIQDKIPTKLVDTLNAAFYKSFQLVFEKGSVYIERTYNKDKIELEHDINNYALDKRINKKHINKMDRHSKQSKLINSSISVIEGSVLGLFGIGLPDIPLFLAVLVRTIYEIALSYGYSYSSSEEKAFLLLLIHAAIAKEEEQKKLDMKLEALGAAIDNSLDTEVDTDLLMRETSNALSQTLLTTKFLQGIPVVGVIGAAVNYSITNRVAKYAHIKYKKRYLQKKV